MRGIGADLSEVYASRGAWRDGREFVLPAKQKLSRILHVREVARQYAMTFGAADNEFQYLSDTACCCSGVDQFPGFQNWFSHQIGYAIWSSRGAAVTYKPISREWCPDGSIDRYLNSRSRLSGRSGLTGSLRDHLSVRWEDPTKSGSPASFYGIMPTEKRSKDGYRIYQWTDEARRLLL